MKIEMKIQSTVLSETVLWYLGWEFLRIWCWGEYLGLWKTMLHGSGSVEECRRLHNEELCVIYSSPDFVRLNISLWMRWAEHVARMGDRTGACRVLVGIIYWKASIGNLRRRWENIINMYLQYVECVGMECIDLAPFKRHEAGVC